MNRIRFHWFFSEILECIIWYIILGYENVQIFFKMLLGFPNFYYLRKCTSNYAHNCIWSFNFLNMFWWRSHKGTYCLKQLTFVLFISYHTCFSYVSTTEIMRRSSPCSRSSHESFSYFILVFKPISFPFILSNALIYKSFIKIVYFVCQTHFNIQL